MADGEKLFNLIDEPWILVRKNSGETAEVSLLDALTHAHDYDALAGELPTQDVAIMRLMLAVLYTVFTRYDSDGSEREYVPDFDDMVDMWKEVWDSGYLPEQPIREYFDKWHERFWLFHPERPFYQANSAKIGTEYTAAKLNGEVSESSNKVRLFNKRTGMAKQELTFSDGARWLLYLNGYDDTSSKPKGKDLPSPGAGWLGKLGLIWAAGANLYETLMLNLTFPDGASDEWYENQPVWERDVYPDKERVKIPLPTNPAELYTLQSRRILLIHNRNLVIGYKLLGGDFFDREGAFSEQMTIWRPIYERKAIIGYQPKRHDSTKQLWREFSSIAVGSENKMPGIVTWQAFLRENELISEEKLCRFDITSVQYGDKDFFVDDVFSDSITFNIDILTKTGVIYRSLIETEIVRCDKFADALKSLASDLIKASGGDPSALGTYAKEQYYYRIDGELRRWIASVSPSQSDTEINESRESWRNRNKQIALELGSELIHKMSSDAFVGREIKDKKGSKEVKYHYSIPEAEIRFIHNIKHIDD